MVILLDSEDEDKKTPVPSTSRLHRDRLAPPMAPAGPPSYAASTAGGSSSGQTTFTAPYSLATTSDSVLSVAGETTPLVDAVEESQALNLEVIKPDDVSLDLPDEDPPEFAPYHATYRISGTGDITSFDKHLNSDPEALCQFIIMHLLSPPQVAVRVVGSHEEVRTEVVTHMDKDGRSRQEFREHRTTITDFDLSLPITSPSPTDESNLIDPAGKLYIVTDDEVVGRGGRRPQRAERSKGQDLKFVWEHHVPRVGGGGEEDKVDVRRRQRKEAAKLSRRIAREGLPPFLPAWLTLWSPTEPQGPPVIGNPPSSVVHRLRNRLLLGSLYLDRDSTQHGPSHTRNKAAEAQVRAWCEEYVADKRMGKVFLAKKEVYGWNQDTVVSGLEKIVRESGYAHDLTITLNTTSSRILIRPPSLLNSLMHAHWSLKLLLTLVLVFPVCWCVDRWSRRTYDVVRCAFPLARMVRYESPSDSVASDDIRPPGGMPPSSPTSASTSAPAPAASTSAPPPVPAPAFETGTGGDRAFDLNGTSFRILNDEIFVLQGSKEELWLAEQVGTIFEAVRASGFRSAAMIPGSRVGELTRTTTTSGSNWRVHLDQGREIARGARGARAARNWF